MPLGTHLQLVLYGRKLRDELGWLIGLTDTSVVLRELGMRRGVLCKTCSGTCNRWERNGEKWETIVNRGKERVGDTCRLIKTLDIIIDKNYSYQMTGYRTVQ